jgi:hypothetical protein
MDKVLVKLILSIIMVIISIVIVISTIIGIVMIIMVTIYQYFLSNPSKGYLLNETPNPLIFIIKAFYILASIGVSLGLIYGLLKLLGVFNQDDSKSNNWGHTVFNILMLCGMLGIIYKLANAGGFLDKNPYYRLILNILLYIPCLLVTLTNVLFGFTKNSSFTKSPPKPFEIKMLILSLILLGSYFSWFFIIRNYIQHTYLKQGGKQLINQPIQTNVLTNVSSYQNLSGNDKFNYQYAISFWFYLDAFAPTSHNKILSILSYGENPAMKYSSENNMFYITVKQKTDDNDIVDFIKEDGKIDNWNDIKKTIENVKMLPFGNDIDADGNRIIYKHSNVQLQKWNNVLLNYNGGTLDVFYNGELVKSAIEVVPYMKFDMLTVGSDNGVSGNVANLMYFKKPLDYYTVNTLYTSLKNNNPPVISTNNDRLIHI